MFRPSINPTVANNKSTGGNATKTSPSKQVLSNNDSTQVSAIREIRNKTIGSGGANPARHLLAARRQAMSMERLNGSATSRATSSSSMSNISSLSDNNNKNDRLSSPNNGSSNSVSGSAASSPSRGSSKGDGGGSGSSGGLNRTASRVSRFRSAKAVFERLSSVNSSSNSSNNNSATKHGLGTPTVKGTVASRYAAAAAARGVLGQQALQSANSNQQSSVTSPRSRVSNGQRMSPLSGGGIKSPKLDNPHPKPQPRVITTATRRTPIITTASQISSNRSGQATPSDQPGTKMVAPRVTPTRLNNLNTANSTSNTNVNQAISTAKPPPKDLIDKIVSEIVRDANQEHDANCTIQDLSNCDISGIPETMDFDKCFQDIEMMTEEEARKLLSRKSDSPPLPSKLGDDDATHKKPIGVGGQVEPVDMKEESELEGTPAVDKVVESHQNAAGNELDASDPVSQDKQSIPTDDSNQRQSTARFKVRFSEEPATVYDTHAASDYDRRNDDIDPVAASAEYEIEKSRERNGLARDDDDDEEQQLTVTMMQMATGRTAVGAVIQRFNNQTTQHSIMKTFEDYQGVSHSHQVAGVYPRAQLIACPGDSSGDKQSMMTQQQQNRPNHNHHQGNRVDSSDYQNHGDEDQLNSQKEYIGTLEREVSLKRILEQNLRDLQSQYYETVKQLDSYKGDAELKVTKLEDELANTREQHESTQGELADVREQLNQCERQLNDIKESSQLLEKKYHRAKRIIKDMQSREESFTKREQLYQQKLDEIEFELGVLIQTIDRTIYEDGLKYFSLLSLDPSGATTNNCSSQHQTRLDVLGLTKRMIENFSNSKKTQSAQIKQRIVTMLEQQLANLLASSNGCASVTAGPVFPIPPVAMNNPSHKPTNSANGGNSTIANNNNDENKHNQNYSYASHRLSQPNMPHPIGVGGQPTKIFHNNAAVTGSIMLNEPSPPQSVNSYPSTNSLNSLNIPNNPEQASSKQLLDSIQMQNHETEHVGIKQTVESFEPKTNITARDNNVQVPYETNEWHDKPVSEWTTTQVSTWLLALGLDQYISKFEDRNVNGQSLINLDSTVLKGLGVLNSNDRNLLKKKIRELRSEMEKERKMMEKRMKENLKEKSKAQSAASMSNSANQTASNQNNRHSWKKGLLS